MLSLFTILSISIGAVFAKTELPTYTYQARVIATQSSCQSEAQNWGSRFERATGINAQSVVCRGEQDFTSGNTTYKIYNLGLRYSANQPVEAYSAVIGKKDIGSAGRLNQVAVYPTFASCAADIAAQAEIYESQTGLVAVTAACEVDPASIRGESFLKIEGFSHRGLTQPAKRIYTFSPSALEFVAPSRAEDVRNFISSFGVTLVKEVPGTFVYYRAEGPAPIQGDLLGTFANDADCATQVASAEQIMSKTGSTRSVVWCHDRRLISLRDGYKYLSATAPFENVKYSTLEQCVNDREFVLSDSRNGKPLGALCVQSLYEPKMHEMVLIRLGF